MHSVIPYHPYLSGSAHSIMFEYSHIKWALIVLLSAHIIQSYVEFPPQIGGGTMALTGFFAHTRVHQIREIKNTCTDNWRHGRINGLECSFASAQIIAWHTFMTLIGIALQQLLGLWMFPHSTGQKDSRMRQ